MSNLSRRLTALEEIAEQARLREVDRVIREAAADRGVDPGRVMELYRECKARSAALRARGLTEAQIEAEIAAGLGLGVDELRARRDELLKRYG